MEINIEEAMKIADYKELFLRIRSIPKKNRERWDLKPKMCTSAQS